MRVEWKAGNEGRASMDTGVVLGVPTLDSGVDPHSGEEIGVRWVNWCPPGELVSAGSKKHFIDNPTYRDPAPLLRFMGYRIRIREINNLKKPTFLSKCISSTK